MARSPSLNIDGVVLLDKPEGLSSNAALQRARRHFGAAKAGHTGTLDPFATGLLPVCLGEATKFSQGLLDADKGYRATALLGVTTDTADREGRVLVERPVATDRAAIEQVLAAFTGTIQQVPPMYSALKHQGRPLYVIARAGGEVERAARTVHVRRLDLVDWAPPLLTFDVLCSKGTYVRTLAEEIGERLGCGAHLTALRRTAVGPFGIERAVTLAELESLAPAQRLEWVLPADLLVQALPALHLGAADARLLLQGRELDTMAAQLEAAGITPPPDGGSVETAGPLLVRLYAGTDPADGSEGLAGSAGSVSAAGTRPVFLGVGGLDSSRRLRSVRLIAHTAGPGGPKTVPPAAKPAESA